MCTKTYHGKERGVFAQKLRANYLSNFISSSRSSDQKMDYNEKVPNPIPNDVKEGHFAVFAVKGSEIKRFMVKIEWLSSPEFLRLLKMAEDEYGFEQAGAIVVPCTPQELENILMAGHL